jgi:hypothetical protein
LELPITVFPNYFEPSLNKNKICIIYLEKPKSKTFNDFFDDLEMFSTLSKTNNNSSNIKKNKNTKIENNNILNNNNLNNNLNKNFDITYEDLNDKNERFISNKELKLKKLGRRTLHLDTFSLKEIINENKNNNFNEIDIKNFFV